MRDKEYRYYFIIIVFLLFLAAIVFVLSLFSGSAAIEKKEIVSLLLERLKGNLKDTPEATVIFNLRIPRILLGFLVGGALSLAGVILQGLFRNPLVEPFTLGVSGGAALLVSVVLALGLKSPLGLPVFAFLGALGAILLVYLIAKTFMSLKTTSLLLVGVMFSFISSSLIMLVLSLSRAEEAHGILFWIMGSLEENEPFFVILLFVSILLISLFAFFKAWELNALSLGEEEASHLGVNVPKAKKIFFLISSLLAGLSVAVTGIIGFVGLVVPHILRIRVSGDHRFLMPASFILGGIFLTLCDTLARTIMAPIELPVGVITGITGGFAFIVILLRRERGTGRC
ncbi:Transport system permease protein [sediment metagenome]|uniref:Transport system permease protein n=1 Tax=sediment metagenome TaxID=749907 RepID=D9PH42_9ZZZZ